MFHISKADFLALRMNPFYCKHANREIVVWNESCAYEVTILVICMKIFLTTNMFHFEKLFCKMLVLNFTNIEQIRIYLFKAAIKFIQVPFYAYQAAAISFFQSIEYFYVAYRTVTFVIIFYYRSNYLTKWCNSR